MKSGSVFDVCVVGAGLSGLLAARALKNRGLRVLVLDKGRGVGGRLSRRRTEGGAYDHGAQYFTARSVVFKELVKSWLGEGLIKEWSKGFQQADGILKDDGESRFCGVLGMTSVPKFLSQELDVRVNARVSKVEQHSSGWKLSFEEGEPVLGRGVILTAPVPQTLQLLASGGTIFPEGVLSDLSRIDYDPCLALMARLRGPSLVPEPGGLWLSGDPVAWIADNSMKGVCGGEGAAITIHAGPQFSRDHWGTDEAVVTRRLLDASEAWLGSSPIQTQLHRWLYSHPSVLYPDRCYFQCDSAPLALAGDGFGGARVEGVALSGLAAAAAMGDHFC
jgi:predicted NAD/FAD-dependent oxidoreductase